MFYEIGTDKRLRDDIKFYYSVEGDIYVDKSIQDFTADEDLESAVLISLLTDRRVDYSEVANQPDPLGVRGFWGDTLLGFPVGSRLWTLKNRTLGEPLLSELETMSTEALQWLVDGGFARSVSAVAKREDVYYFQVVVTIVLIDKHTIQAVYYYNHSTGTIGG